MKNKSEEAELICSNCGAPLPVKAGEKFIKCRFCETVFEASVLTRETQLENLKAMQADAKEKIQQEQEKTEQEKQRLRQQEIKKAKRQELSGLFQKSRFQYLLYAFLLFALVFIYPAYDDGFLLSAGILAVGAVLTVVVLLIGYQVIPIGSRYLPKCLGTAVVILSVVLFFTNFYSRRPANYDDAFMIEWDSLTMGERVSELEDSLGYVFSDTGDSFRVELYDCTRSQFKDYVRYFKDRAYHLDLIETTHLFSGTAEDGYTVDVSMNEDERCVTIAMYAPVPLTENGWPESELFQLVPAPQCTRSYISYNSGQQFTIVVGDFTEEMFYAYCDELEKSGFTVDQYRNDGEFWANNASGSHVSCQYSQLDQMSISFRKAES